MESIAWPRLSLASLRQMFRFAVTRDLLASDPTALLSKKSIGGANVERDRVLDEDEIKELAKKLPTANMAETGRSCSLDCARYVLPNWRTAQSSMGSRRP